ncbi:hypothetical protein EV2_024043 [Malus domestica]
MRYWFPWIRSPVGNHREEEHDIELAWLKSIWRRRKASKRKILADALLPHEIIRHVCLTGLSGKWSSISGLDGNVVLRKKSKAK